MTQLSQQDLSVLGSQLYDHFHNPSLGLVNVQHVAQAIRQKNPAEGDARGVAQSIRLMQRIAREVSREQFIDFVEHDKLPPIKLSPQEMEIAKGGNLFSKICAAVGGIIALIPGGQVIGGGIALLGAIVDLCC